MTVKIAKYKIETIGRPEQMKRELLAATALGSFAFGYSTETNAQAFNWNGPYVGGLFSYGNVGSRAATFQPSGAPASGLNFPGNVPTFNPALPIAALSTGPFSSLPSLTTGGNGLQAGATLGYNRQIDHLVFGLETDFAYFGTANASGFNQQTVTVNGVRTTTGSASVGTDWLYTLRGRIGYAQGRLLVFGTGGLALGQTRLAGNFGINENNLAFTPTPGGFIPGKGTTTSTSTSATAFGSQAAVRAGFTLGGGAEYAVTDHVTLKLEGLYYDLGSTSAGLYGTGSYRTTTTVNPIFVPPTTTTTAGAVSVQPLRVLYRFDGALARVGVNYKF